jgi:putative transposase
MKDLQSKQRNLHRKKRNSNNRKRARKAVANRHAKISNSRKATANTVKSSSLIAVATLNIKEMSSAGSSKKRGLNREILSAAPGMFHQMLK